MLIGIVGWIVLGLVAGLIGSKFVDLRGDDPRLGILFGGAGALIGGGLYSLISGNAVTPFNLPSLMVAAIAAVGAIVAWHTFRHSTTTMPRSRR